MEICAHFTLILSSDFNGLSTSLLTTSLTTSTSLVWTSVLVNSLLVSSSIMPLSRINNNQKLNVNFGILYTISYS
jgi:hypothetical protein